MPSLKKLILTAGLVVLGVLIGVPQSHAADDSGLQAIDEYRLHSRHKNAIENRFFLKEGRFELTPFFGYVPNNPFAKRFLGGVHFGYHLSEELQIKAIVSYAPDLKEGDLKGLVSALVTIAEQSSSDFQQPLDKLTLWTTVGAAWAPIYGKINLLGEIVVNFDLYAFGGLGIVSKTNYFAIYDQSSPNRVALQGGTNEVEFSPALGIGGNFFVNQTVAIKLDSTFAFWVDNNPAYCDINAPGCVPPTGKSLYNNLVVSVGVGFFFPRMKPRLYEF